jgi:hypothetical protein
MPFCFERVDTFFRLALQHRERDHVVVDLRDHFVDDLHLAFLGEELAGANARSDAQSCKIFESH